MSLLEIDDKILVEMFKAGAIPIGCTYEEVVEYLLSKDLARRKESE